MSVRLLMTICALLVVCGCVRTTQASDGFEVYASLAHAEDYSYALRSDAPDWIDRLGKISVNYWNQHLKKNALRWNAKGQKARVQIQFNQTEDVSLQPAHASIGGCHSASPTTCAIVLNLPEEAEKYLETHTSVIFEAGALDRLLSASKSYDDSQMYARDKLTLLILVHEMGHTIGLGHTNNAKCVMATRPSGAGEFCDAELKIAARLIE